MKKLIAWGENKYGDDKDDKKGSVVGGIHVDKPGEIRQVHSEDPSSIMYMDGCNGEPGSSLGSARPALGPFRWTWWSSRGHVPGYFIQMLQMLNTNENLDLESQIKFIFDLTHDDGTDYSGAPMSDQSARLFGGSFTSLCPTPLWGDEASGKAGATL